MQPGVGLASRLDGRTPVNRAAVPQEDDLSPQMPQERSKKASDSEGLEVARLEAEVPTHVLARGRHGERCQR
jgi:hypothetical protein